MKSDTYFIIDLIGVCNIQSLEKSLVRNGERGRVTINRLLSHTNAFMTAVLVWEWCVLTIYKRCRLESIT